MFPLSSLCQWFHCQAGASWCQLWCIKDMHVLKCWYQPLSSYISRSAVIQNSHSPILLRSWWSLLVLLQT
jgi:hypothetical protein